VLIPLASCLRFRGSASGRCRPCCRGSRPASLPRSQVLGAGAVRQHISGLGGRIPDRICVSAAFRPPKSPRTPFGFVTAPGGQAPICTQTGGRPSTTPTLAEHKGQTTMFARRLARTAIQIAPTGLIFPSEGPPRWRLRGTGGVNSGSIQAGPRRAPRYAAPILARSLDYRKIGRAGSISPFLRPDGFRAPTHRSCMSRFPSHGPSHALAIGKRSAASNALPAIVRNFARRGPSVFNKDRSPPHLS